MSFQDKRRHPRKDVFSAVLIAIGDEGYLSEVWDISHGGARVGKPQHWQLEAGTNIRAYFMLDQETVICLKANVARIGDDFIGLEFVTEQSEQIAKLMYEARFSDSPSIG